MNVILIQPLMQMRPMDTSLKTRMSPSLGLLTVAQSIREGNSIKLLNENVNVVSASHGCPFNCDFCYNSTANIRNSFVKRRIDDVIGDIKTLGRKHIKCSVPAFKTHTRATPSRLS